MAHLSPELLRIAQDLREAGPEVRRIVLFIILQTGQFDRLELLEVFERVQAGRMEQIAARHGS